MQKTSGLALPVALVMGSVIAMAVFSLSLISSSELKMVSKLTVLTKAEALAFSGLQLVEDRLFKSRWYQPQGDEFSNPAAIWKSFHHERIDRGENQYIDIYLDEFPSAHKLTVYRKGGHFNIGLLDNIRVLAVGTSGGEKALVYGKFIVSTEPQLNSNSTDGVKDGFLPEIVNIFFQPRLTDRQSKVIPAGYLFAITNVYVKAGDIITSSVKDGVDIGTANATKIAEIKIPDGAESHYGAELEDGLILAPYNGTILEVYVEPGGPEKGKIMAGAVVAKMQKDQEPEAMNYSLKRMVRIQRLKNEFARTDLSRLENRKTVYSKIKENNEEFVRNYFSVCKSSKIISDAFREDLTTERMSVEKAVEKMKRAKIEWHKNSTDEGKKQILKQMLAMFCPPEIMDHEERDKFRKRAEFLLGGKKIDPAEMGKIDPDVESVFAGLEHGIKYPVKTPLAFDRYKNAGQNLYSLQGQEEFVAQMSGFENFKPESQPPASLSTEIEKFIWRFSRLPDSKLAIKIDIPAGGEISNYLWGSWEKTHTHDHDKDKEHQEFVNEFIRATGGLRPDIDVKKNDYFRVTLQNPNLLPGLDVRWRYFFKRTHPLKLKIEETLMAVPYTYVNDATVGSKNKPQKLSLQFRTDYLMKFFAKYFDDDFSREPSAEDPKGRSMASFREGSGPGVKSNVLHGGQM
jgi:hypothetical protein